jgi:hypothetical protein
MCENSCQGNGNIQRLRSMLKDQKSLLVEMENEVGFVDNKTPTGGQCDQASPYMRGCAQMMAVVRARIARTESLIERAQDQHEYQQNHKPTLIGVAQA